MERLSEKMERFNRINGNYKMKNLMLTRLLALLLILTTMCAMVGCSSKGPVDINKFEKRARRYDFGALHYEDKYVEDDSVIDFVVAYNKEMTMQVQWFKLTDADAAATFYRTNVDQFQKFGNGGGGVDSDLNLTYYVLVADGYVYEANCVGDTCIIVMGKSSEKENADNFLKNIGYLPK